MTPLGLLGLATVLQHETRQGLELGLLQLVPVTLAVTAWSLLRARRSLPPTAPHLASLVLTGLAGGVSLLVYPVPPLVAHALHCSLAVVLLTQWGRAVMPAVAAFLRGHATALERVVVGGLLILALASLLGSRATYNAFDEGLELVPAAQLVGGAVPFRDFYCYRLPGHELGLAGWFLLTGVSLASARLWALMLAMLSLVALYLLGRHMLSLPDRLALLAYSTFAVVPGHRVASHWNLSLCAGIWSCTLAVLSARRVRPAAMQLCAGLAAGVAICSTWSLGLLTTVGLVTAAVASEGSFGARIRAAARLAVGAALPPAVLISILCLLGQGPRMSHDLVLANAKGYASFNLGATYFYNGWYHLFFGLQQVWDGAILVGLSRSVATLVVGLGPPLVAVLALAEGGRALFRCTDVRRLSLGGCSVAFFLSAFSLPSWEAVLRVSPPAIAYLLCVHRAATVTRWPRARRLFPAVLFLVAVTLAAEAAQRAWVEGSSSTHVKTRRGDDVTFPDRPSSEAFHALQEQIVSLSGGPPRSLFILFHEPGWHFHLACAPWYRSPNYIPGYFVDQEEVAARLRSAPPDAVIYSERYVRASYRFKDPRFLRRDPSEFFESPVVVAIRERFRPVGHFDALTFGDGHVTLYVPR